MSPPVDAVVRALRSDDVEVLVELFDAVAAEGRWIAQESPIDRDRMRRIHAETLSGDRPDQATFVATADGAIVGTLGIGVSDYGVAGLGMLVADGHRGRGIGRALLDAAVAWAREHGAHKVALEVWPHNERARALYERAGFVEEGVLRAHYRRNSGELWDAVVMGLVL